MTTVSDAPRPALSTALLRGLTGRCPQCGKGKMFRAFLQVADHCPECGEALLHHRADDMPAYLVIVLVGHILVPMVFSVDQAYAPPYWLQFSVWMPVTAALCVGLLQPVKGVVVALQWSLKMHGFGRTDVDETEGLLADGSC
jgi:uncharacterized protein (DUF983 family)